MLARQGDQASGGRLPLPARSWLTRICCWVMWKASGMGVKLSAGTGPGMDRVFEGLCGRALMTRSVRLPPTRGNRCCDTVGETVRFDAEAAAAGTEPAIRTPRARLVASHRPKRCILTVQRGSGGTKYVSFRTFYTRIRIERPACHKSPSPLPGEGR